MRDKVISLALLIMVSISACQTLKEQQFTDTSTISSKPSTSSIGKHTTEFSQSSIPNPDLFPPELSDANIIANQNYLTHLPPLKPNDIEVIQVEVEESSENDICQLHISYPQIIGLSDTKVESEINQYLENLFLNQAIREDYGLVRPFDVDTCEENLIRISNLGCIEDEDPRTCVQRTYTVKADYIVGINSNNLLSIRDDGYITNHFPSAHPTKHRVWTTIDLTTGEIYACEDFFKSDAVSTAQLAQLMRRPSDARCLLPTFVTETGLVVAPYGSHSSFWATYEIPYIFLAELIKSDGPLQMFLQPAQHLSSPDLHR